MIIMSITPLRGFASLIQEVIISTFSLCYTPCPLMPKIFLQHETSLYHLPRRQIQTPNCWTKVLGHGNDINSVYVYDSIANLSSV